LHRWPPALFFVETELLDGRLLQQRVRQAPSLIPNGMARDRSSDTRHVLILGAMRSRRQEAYSEGGS
jgi:hypothetical protein